MKHQVLSVYSLPKIKSLFDILLFMLWLTLTSVLCSPSATAQKLPEYIGNVGGTQLTNTNGQWVRIDPASPGNSEILESRIFKMPQKGVGVVGIEFKLVGADGGTARYLWGANNQFSKGGGGGQIQFTMDLSKKIWLGFQHPYETQMYGQPFFVTYGKKGESKQISKGYYVSAGGGGSTGMSWIVGGASHTELNDRYLIAAAGGGGGGFSYVYGTLNGNSAIRNAKTDPGSISSTKNIGLLTYGYDEQVGEADLSIVSGSGDLVDGGFIPSTCCTTNSKRYFAMSLVHYRLEWSSVYGGAQITHGQGGGQPVAVFASTEGETNYTGLGIRSKAYEVWQLGGKGGAGFGGGGAGSSTTSASDMDRTADKIPTGGAGGTGSIIRSGVAHTFPNNGEGGFNNYTAEFANNVSISSRTQTDNPQSGYMMYRTIADTEKPQINISNITVYLRDGDTPLGYRSTVSLTEAMQPYMMKTDGLWDNDGITSVTATVSGQPFTQFDCSVARQDVPMQLTVTDVAGNATTKLVMVKVIDPFKPISMDVSASSQINVNDGPVTLTAASFPQAYDGCNGSNVIINFPPTTFYCNDVGSHAIQYYYTDRDGNNSQVYAKTFNIVCSNANTGTSENGTTNWRYLYVDQTASGTGDGSSWANAFTSLQDALNYPYPATIYVAKGTYYPTSSTDRTVSFVLKDNAQVYGGFPNGGSSFTARNPEANPTILSGKISSTDNSYHVVTIAGNNTRLEGFTIRDGKADKNSTDGGGGLLLSQAATHLGADHNTTIRNCKLISNYGTYGGAAFFEYKNQTNSNNLHIENCAFNDNSTYYSGGAVFLRNPSATDNMHAKFVNALFSGNTANAGGGAVALDSYASAELTNCTFSDNHAVSNGGALFSNGKVKLHNSILYFNTSTNNPQTGEIYRNGGTIEVDYSNIQGSGGSGSWSLGSVQDMGHNIDADPLFNASPALSISWASPCHNAGKNEYNSETYDIYGKNYRIQNVIDMGAFEATGNVVFVAADAAVGGDGLSWATAFNNLSDGIAAAGIGANQKDIWVKAGTYRPDRLPGINTVTPNNRENSFYVSFALKIYGGFAGNETSTAQRNIGQNPTILSGDIGTPNNASDNAYHVITLMAGDARLDGLIIEGGNANDAGNGDHRKGGGIYESVLLGNGKNSIANCIFRNNQAQEMGGAWFAAVGQTSTTDVVQTVFYNNAAPRGAVSYIQINHPNALSYDQNFYNVSVSGNPASASGAAFEAYELSGRTVRFNFYNSVLAGNAPQNYSPAHTTLSHTVATALGTDVFTNPSNPAGADGKIMTADDGLMPGVYSPAISYGDATLLYNYNGKDQDIAGSPRIVNKLDAGAYESSYNAPLAGDGQGIIYVRPIAAGEGTGSSWENATSDLHNAIHTPGVQKVFVSIGTYKVGAHSFIMKNGVEIYGGFDPANGITDLSHKRLMPDPTDAYATSSTMLDGQLVRPVIWNVFTAGTAMNSTAVLDGFYLKYGKHPTGGGVRNIYASPTLRNVVMTNNQATVAGAGMYNENSSPALTNVLISQNRIDTRFIPASDPVYGGGIYNTTNSNPVLTNVTIAENQLLTAGTDPTYAQKHGAGIYNLNSSPVIRNSIFFNNAKSYNTAIAGADIQDEGSSVTDIKYSITQSYDTGNPSDNNKVGVNPNFKNFGARDFRLTPGSPAIDAGDNALFVGLDADSKDLAGNPRVFDTENGKKIDMGAYEYNCIPVDYHAVNFDNLTVVYDGNPHSITVENLLENVSASYEITDIDHNTTAGNTATNAGTYTITATIQPQFSGIDCTPIIKYATLHIRKAEAVITAESSQTHVYDGTVKNVLASLNHTEAALDYAPEQDYTDPGIYWVTVSAPETANYLAASEAVVLAIEKADFTGITLEDAEFTYDGTPKSLAITGTLPEGASVVYDGNERTDAGTHIVNVLIQMSNYNDMWLSADLTINKVDIDITGITFADGSFVYDGTAKSLAVTGSLPGDATVSYTGNAQTDAGTYPVTATISRGPNYNDLVLHATLTITLPVISPDTDGIVYVNQNVAGGSGEGYDWDNAVLELADALQAAQTNTAIKQIWVAKGMYLPKYKPASMDSDGNPTTDRDKMFLLVKDVKIYGGFDPENGLTDLNTRNPQLATTTLSGDIGIPGVNTDNAYHVVLSVGDVGAAELNGFTIEDGYAFGGTATLNIHATNNIQRYVGAGIYIVESSPLIARINIRDNMAMTAGAGMYLTYSFANLTNVRISDNTTYGDGGGIFNGNSVPVLTNVLIDNNRASSRGGGMINGVSSPILTNVTMTDNQSQIGGGGMVNTSGSSPAIRNSIIYGNTPNNIWNTDVGNNPTFSHSLIQGNGSDAWNSANGTDGGNNIGADPLFVDVVGRNYRLQVGSPAADIGDNTLFYASSTPNLSAVTTDLDGNPRISEDVIDLGAYEQLLSPPVVIVPDGNGIAYVKPTATGTGNGSRWEDATADLQGAINSGATRVFVAVGNYNVPLTRNGFVMKNGVAIYGGFVPDNGITDLTHNRILPAAGPSVIEGSVLNGRNIKSVIRNEFTSTLPLENTAVLDGFTVTDGNAADGGGIFNEYASPVLTHLVIRNNRASGQGGGLFNREASPVLNDIVVIDNTATGQGGGIYTGRADDLKMTNVLVKGNTAGNGGGIYHFDTQSVLANVAIIGNNATGTNTGSAFHTYSGANRLVNVTIAGNTGNAFYNGATAFLDNSIVYGGIDGLGYTAQYSLIEGNTDTANGNMDATGITLHDIFNAPGSADYTLSSSSAAVNTGSNSLFAGLDTDSKDLAGNPRLYGSSLDLGAYELQTEPVIIITPDADGIVYVRPVAIGSGRGNDWNNATADLQGAIHSGARKVFVAVGDYPVPPSGSFTMKNEVEIYGGFDPDHNIVDLNDERILPNHDHSDGTLLKGQYQHPVIANNSLDNTAVLDGFTITGGKDETAGGGGIANMLASPVLRNLVIKGNRATWDGGGIYNFSSSPLLTNVVLSGNTAESGWGGALANWEGSNPVLVNVLISDNTAADFGGGIYNFASSPSLTNVTIVNNVATAGSGIFSEFGATVQINNSIIYGNTGQAVVSADPITDVLTFSYSLVQDSYDNDEWDSSIGTDGENNINGDPLFVDILAKDYRLKPESSVINKGSNSLFAGLGGDSKDLAGNPRLVGAAIDMGAYESQKKAQLINPIADVTKTYGDDDFEPGATTNTGSKVSYHTADNSIAEAYEDAADGNKWKIKIKKAGVVVITASQLGDNEYLPAADVDFTLTVNKKPAVVRFTADAISKVYDGTVYGTVTTANLRLEQVLHADDVQVQLLDANVTYSDRNVGTGKDVTLLLSSVGIAGEDAENYLLSNTDDLHAAVGEISAASLYVVASPGQHKWYGSSDPALTYAVSGLQPGDNLSILQGELGRTVGEDVGSYPINEGTLTAGNNYHISFTTGADFHIYKADITGISFTDRSFVYDGTSKSLALSGTLPVGTTVSYTNNSRTDAGTQEVTATISGANYNEVVLKANLTITKADMTGVSFTDGSFVYDGTSKSLALSGTLPVGATVSYTDNSRTDVGTQEVTATISGANYEDLVLKANLTITKATTAGISFADGSFVYDGTARSLAISGTLPVGATVSYTDNSRTDVGTQEVTATISGANYEDLVLKANLTITKATIAGISLTDGSFVYDGTSKSLALLGTRPAGTTVSYTDNSRTDVGTQEVTAMISGANYEDLVLKANLTITKSDMTGISLTDGSFVYDGTARSLVITGTLPAGTTVSYTDNSRTDVGTQEVTATISGANYKDLVLTANLTITKATIAGISLTDDSFVYDGTSKSLAISGELPAGTTVSYTDNSRTDVGTQEVTATISGANYEDLVLTANLTITKADITGISFSEGSFVYDGTAKTLTINGTLPTGVTVHYEHNGQTNAGVYIVIANIDGGNNFNNLSLSATLSIQKASLEHLQLTDASFTYDGTVRYLQVEGIIPTGLEPIYQNNEQRDAGIYEVTVVIEPSANYKGIELAATLEIKKAKQSITFNSPGVLRRDAGEVLLDVSASSGLPVSLVVDEPSIASIKGTTLGVHRLGTVTVTARQEGNSNYEAAEIVILKIQIAADADAKIPIRVHQAVSPNGDGINEFLMIEGIGDFPQNKITIFDKSGRPLQTIEGYNNQDRKFTGEDYHDGTYYYYLDVMVENQLKREKGFFVIKR